MKLLTQTGSKCNGLFYEGPDKGPKGTCPADGKGHIANPVGYTSGWYNYVLAHFPLGPRQQPDWRFCQRCFAMFFDGNSDKGAPSMVGATRHPDTISCWITKTAQVYTHHPEYGEVENASCPKLTVS